MKKPIRRTAALLTAAFLVLSPIAAAAQGPQVNVTSALPAAGAGYYFSFGHVLLSSIRQEEISRPGAEKLLSAGAAATVADADVVITEPVGLTLVQEEKIAEVQALATERDAVQAEVVAVAETDTVEVSGTDVAGVTETDVVAVAETDVVEVTETEPVSTAETDTAAAAEADSDLIEETAPDAAASLFAVFAPPAETAAEEVVELAEETPAEEVPALAEETQLPSPAETPAEAPAAAEGVYEAPAATEVMYEAAASQTLTEEASAEAAAAAAPAAEAEAMPDIDLIVVRGDGYVNVRSGPGTDYDIVGKMYDCSKGRMIGIEGDWYKMESGEVTGYIKAEFCMTGTLAMEHEASCNVLNARITATSLNVRADASTEAEVLTQLNEGELLRGVTDLGEWVSFAFDNRTAFVSKEFVSLEQTYRTAESRAEEEARLARERAAEEARLAKEAEERARQAAAAGVQQQQAAAAEQTASAAQAPAAAPKQVAPAPTPQNYRSAEEFLATMGSGDAVAAFAIQFVGNPYVHGGTSLTNGADCSGFTQSVYKQFGISLPRIPEAQGTVGTPVDGIANALPGDVICYPGHVAIYIGNGQIVHASGRRTGIIIGNASYRAPTAIRRMF